MGHMSVRLSTYDGGIAEEFLLNLIMANSAKMYGRRFDVT